MKTRLRTLLWGLLLGLILACRGRPSRPEQPAWCRALPRPEYRPLDRVPVSDPWFVLRAAP